MVTLRHPAAKRAATPAMEMAASCWY